MIDNVNKYSKTKIPCLIFLSQVFVVLEGEITVVLHTTQFNAKKGDSFYIPPKNYYNLINNKAREAELSLIQVIFRSGQTKLYPISFSQSMIREKKVFLHTCQGLRKPPIHSWQFTLLQW